MCFAQVESNRILQTEIERIANQCVADRYLINPGNTGEKVAQIIQIQIVAGVQSKTHFAGTFGSGDVGLNGLFAVGVVACGVSLCV